MKQVTIPDRGKSYPTIHGALLAIYDLNICPVTYDITNFLVLADIEREKRRLKHIVFIIVPGKHGGFNNNKVHSTSEKSFRLKNLLVSATALMPSVNGCIILKNRRELLDFWKKEKPNIFPINYKIYKPCAEYSWRHTWKAYQQGNELQRLRATPDSLKSVKKWLERNRLVEKILVTITLRESSYETARNSNLKAWANFSASLMNKGYQVLVIRDFEKAFEPLPYFDEDILVCDKASWDLNFRVGLYETAFLNYFVNNGPWMLAVFDKEINHIGVKITTESVHVTSTKHRLAMGDNIGVSYPFLGKSQMLVWKDDTLDVLMASFERFKQKNSELFKGELPNVQS